MSMRIRLSITMGLAVILIGYVAARGNLNFQAPSPNPPSLDVASLGGGNWVALYNGTDLSGWKSEPGHVGHWQGKGRLLTYDGKSEAADKNLFTEKEYRDFMMVVDWRLPGPIRQQPRPVVLPNGDDAKGPDGRTQTKAVPYAGDSGILPRGSGKAQLPGIPERGPIGLQHHGDPLEFANLYIKEL